MVAGLAGSMMMEGGGLHWPPGAGGELRPLQAEEPLACGSDLEDELRPRPAGAARVARVPGLPRAALALAAVSAAALVAVLSIGAHGPRRRSGGSPGIVGEWSLFGFGTDEAPIKRTLCGNTSQELFIAVSDGDTERTECLLDHGVDVDSTEHFHDHMGYTALTQAAARGHSKAVQILLDRGADVNKADDNHETALAGAAWQGYAEIVKLLLDRRAEVDATNRRGKTPLYEAVQVWTNIEVVRLLLQHKADVNRYTAEGRSILAAAHSKENVVGLLVLHGARCSPMDWQIACPQPKNHS